MPDIMYPIVGDRVKRLRDMGDGTFAEIGAQAAVLPVSWATPSTPYDGRLFGDVEIQLIGTPSTAYVFQDSLDGTNFNDCYAFDKNGMPLSAVGAPGRYRLPGNCFVKARVGTGATFMIRAGS
ncbi:hypothetical protein [Novosphingobium sp. FKTRR1]|uniref:hypothetical protein n=1 Tax=Novosphingobium sp. FKTRR1 TaxID=2879118 RepID=UPI001CF04D70|nr:hypothetical protein [Novosphingobium sp. FKTRR1]